MINALHATDLRAEGSCRNHQNCLGGIGGPGARLVFPIPNNSKSAHAFVGIASEESQRGRPWSRWSRSGLVRRGLIGGTHQFESD